MKFIPDRLKRIFSRKSRKAETPAPAAAETALPPAAEPQPAKKYTIQDARRAELERYKTPEGNFLLDLDISIPGGAYKGQLVHMIRSYQSDFLLALVGPSPFSQCKTVAMAVEEHMDRAFGFDVGKVYFKHKDGDFWIDGYDQIVGLPPGGDFRIVLVPEGSDWRPEIVMPAQYPIPGTNTVLQHPATLTEPYMPPWQLLMINGFNVREPQLPDFSVLPPRTEKLKEETPAQPAAASPAPPQPPKP
jgi:hypothetical protein